MSWIAVICLAALAMALGLFALRADRRMWPVLGASLALGLAGYAAQGSPTLPGAPASTVREANGGGWELVQARQELIPIGRKSRNEKVLIADALTRQGQHENAAILLRGAANENPRDAEAWLALGNVLVEHTGGQLSPAALTAYRRASLADPQSVAPGYFLGLALIRQGNLLEGRNVWQEVIDKAPQGSFGRDIVAERLARLDLLLQQMAKIAEERGK